MKSHLFARLTPLALALLAVQANAASNVSAYTNLIQPQALQIDNKATATSKVAAGNVQLASNRYIVELEDAPLAMYNGSIASLSTAPKDAAGRIETASVQAKAYLARLQSQQQVVASALTRKFSGLTVQKHFGVLFNGFVVAGNNLDMAAIKAVSGVKRVYRDRLMKATASSEFDKPLELINAPAQWQALGGSSKAGQGVRVAVIDSGIRPENPMFDDTGFTAPSNLPSDDYCHTTDSSFCNNKLIVARYYDAPSDASSSEYSSPKGYNSHGSHVAGIAVGDPVAVTTSAGESINISGVAPGAYLMVYKALYQAGDSAYGSSASLLSALEDAVNDGADVINNSWGGGAGMDPALSPYPDVYAAAEQAGVVMVSAAGNDGAADSTIGCPACSEAGIAVANTQTGRYLNTNTLTVDGSDYVAFGGGTSTTDLSSFSSSELSGTLVSAATVDASNIDACAAFPADAFDGNMALVTVGSSCSFATKVTNLEAAGAVGMIMYRTDDEVPYNPLVSGATIPVAMIDSSDGNTLTSLLASGGLAVSLDANYQTGVLSQWTDSVNGSSSRGPNGNGDVLKPDLAAPGTDIISAGSPDTTAEFTVMTGTSMASPAVAGAVAVLKGAHSGWTPKQIKAALTTTATTAITDWDGKTQATPFAMGAGRIDLQTASSAGLGVAPVSLASSNCVISCSFNVNASNLGSAASSWTGTLSFDDSSVTGTLNTGNSDNSALLALSSASATKSFSVTVDTSLASKDKWYFGTLVFKDSSGTYPDAHLPIAVYAGSQSEGRILAVSSTGADDALGLGDSATLQVQYSNREQLNTTSLTINIPQGLTLDGTPQASTTGTTASYSYNDLSHVIAITGILDHASASFSDATAALSPFASLGSYGASGVSCDSSTADCDENNLSITVPSDSNIEFMGKTVTSMSVDFNGFLRINGASLAADIYAASLPSDYVSGAVIAPFWTDLAMTSDSRLYAGTLTKDGDNYLVVEWSKFALASDTSKTYSFQVLFLENSDKVYIHYLDMSSLPTNLTAGAQDASGYTGASLYNYGSGSAPSSNIGFSLGYQAPDTLSMNADLAPAPRTLGIELNANASASLALTKGLVTGKLPITVTSNSIGASAKAASLWQVADTALATSNSVTISTAPSHGTVAVASDGTATYTPETDFTGSDSFGYTLTDSAGATSLEGLVTVTVDAVSGGGDTDTSDNDASNNDDANTDQGGGGGAFGILTLLMLPLAWQRRRSLRARQ
ncbi:S8 family serine peptidase [Gallaecimonas mangrovi]|uniref:S8 family serine peptidase n=1 Tax=Gallaecimonas mangrovi TaxID=2291597 RepID=UPI000E2040ED|nr:S8 family serine peptidase [Gallaecimonas mangrovi]